MTVEINGLSVNYESFEPAVPETDTVVFVLHGWGANLNVYRSIAAVTAAKYRTVLFDFPGFGLSDEPEEPWDVSQFTDLARRFIESFGCKKVILIAHSFGGRVTIKLCTEFREQCAFEIEKIILTDSAGIRPKRSFKSKCRTRVYKIAKRFVLLPPVKKLYPDALNALQKKFGSADYAAASPVMRQCLVKTVNEDLSALLPQIKVPALLVWGDKDTATPLSDGQYMEQVIKGSGLVTLNGAGHFSFLDQPAVYAAVLRSFLEIGA